MERFLTERFYGYACVLVSLCLPSLLRFFDASDHTMVLQGSLVALSRGDSLLTGDAGKMDSIIERRFDDGARSRSRVPSKRTGMRQISQSTVARLVNRATRQAWFRIMGAKRDLIMRLTISHKFTAFMLKFMSASYSCQRCVLINDSEEIRYDRVNHPAEA